MKTFLPILVFLFGLSALAQTPGQSRLITLSCSSPDAPGSLAGKTLYVLTCSINASVAPTQNITGCAIRDFNGNSVPLTLARQDFKTATFQGSDADFPSGVGLTVILNKTAPYSAYISANSPAMGMVSCR